MAARHNILPTFCRFLWWQLGKQFLEQKGGDQGFRIPNSEFWIPNSGFWIPGRLLLFWHMNFSCRTNNSWLFYPIQCSFSQFWDFWTLRRLETSELIAVLRLPNFSQSGDFYTLPYGYKREKKRKKVQNHPETRRQYGTGQEKIDIKHRKSRKKSKIIRKLEGNTEQSRRKWT